jgi:hypothetical protein
MSIGSTVPFAYALRTMLRRSTGAVSITSAGSVLFLQPPSAAIATIAMHFTTRFPGVRR